MVGSRAYHDPRSRPIATTRTHGARENLSFSRKENNSPAIKRLIGSVSYLNKRELLRSLWDPELACSYQVVHDTLKCQVRGRKPGRLGKPGLDLTPRKSGPSRLPACIYSSSSIRHKQPAAAARCPHDGVQNETEGGHVTDGRIPRGPRQHCHP